MTDAARYRTADAKRQQLIDQFALQKNRTSTQGELAVARATLAEALDDPAASVHTKLAVLSTISKLATAETQFEQASGQLLAVETVNEILDAYARLVSQVLKERLPKEQFYSIVDEITSRIKANPKLLLEAPTDEH